MIRDPGGHRRRWTRDQSKNSDFADFVTFGAALFALAHTTKESQGTRSGGGNPARVVQDLREVAVPLPELPLALLPLRGSAIAQVIGVAVSAL